MKQSTIILTFVCICSLFHSCSRDEINDSISFEQSSDIKISKDSTMMQRAIFRSRQQFTDKINQLSDNPTSAQTRALIMDVEFSNEDVEFVSLLEENKRNVYESLTPAQLDTLNNDEDDLEFCPSDSVISDSRFAQLLNAHREIQIADTVYKYVPNGVAYTSADNAPALREIEEDVANIEISKEIEGKVIQLNNNVNFTPIQFQQSTTPEHIDGADDTTNSSTNSSSEINEPGGIKLPNGYVLPKQDIRDINYKDNGDGGWLHKFITGIFGKNVVAINKFEKGRKLTMELYDQNYIIYANIGVKLKMQKRVCGIWWNIKTEEMVLGWDMISLKYTFPKPTIQYFTNPETQKQEYPSNAWYLFPHEEEKRLLFTIPIVNYDFTGKDVNKVYNSLLKSAISSSANMVKSLIGTNEDKAGLMTFCDKSLSVMAGPKYINKTNVRSVQKDFYAKLFPGTFVIGFNVGGDGLKFNGVELDLNDRVDLDRCSVYGAIKYKGRWLGARIIKDRD